MHLFLVWTLLEQPPYPVDICNFQRSSNHQSIPHSGIVHYWFVPSGCFKNLSSKKLLLHMHFHIATKCNYSQWWSLQGKGINLWKCIWMLKVDSPYAVLQGCISIPSRCQCCIACPQQMQEHLLWIMWAKQSYRDESVRTHWQQPC